MCDLHKDEFRKILCVYTGGTIGMKPSPKGYVPDPGFFEQHLASSSMFHDPEFLKPNGVTTETANGSKLSEGWLITQKGRFG